MQEAILAGIFNDLGSGSNVDVTTIKQVNGKVEVIKEFNCIKPNEVSELRSQINRDIVTHIPRGATRTFLWGFAAEMGEVLNYHCSVTFPGVLSSKTELFPANIVVEEATPMEL